MIARPSAGSGLASTQFWWFCHQLVHTTDRISMTEGPPGPTPSAGTGIPKEVPKPYTVPEGYVAPKMSELWLYVSSSQPLSKSGSDALHEGPRLHCLFMLGLHLGDAG